MIALDPAVWRSAGLAVRALLSLGAVVLRGHCGRAWPAPCGATACLPLS